MLAILKKSGFWYTLLFLNFLVPTQPAMLSFSAGIVVLLFVMGKLIEACHWISRSPARQRTCAVVVLWPCTGVVLGGYLLSKGWIKLNEDALLLVCGLNLALWIVPCVLYRLWRN